MKVLVACEESQEVCKAFRALGHEAYSCDIQPCSGGHPEWHIQGDVIPIINGDCTFTTMDGHTHTNRTVGHTDRTSAMYLSDECRGRAAIWCRSPDKRLEPGAQGLGSQGLFYGILQCKRQVNRHRKPGTDVLFSATGTQSNHRTVLFWRSMEKTDMFMADRAAAFEGGQNRGTGRVLDNPKRRLKLPGAAEREQADRKERERAGEDVSRDCTSHGRTMGR